VTFLEGAQGLLSRFVSVYLGYITRYITQRLALKEKPTKPNQTKPNQVAQGLLWWVAMSLPPRCFFIHTHSTQSDNIFNGNCTTAPSPQGVCGGWLSISLAMTERGSTGGDLMSQCCGALGLWPPIPLEDLD
jgi:hypothetical protein